MWQYVLYVGESKIICNIGTCFAVGYTAGWAWQDTHGLLLSYHCGAGVALIVHFCHEFYAINMDTRISFAPKRVEGTDPFLWAEGVPGAKMHRMMSVQCSIGTVSCRNELSVNGLRGSKMVVQGLSMGKEPDANPHPLLMQTWNESIAWSCRTDR